MKALAADVRTPERQRRVLEQALVFTGAVFAGVYAPGDDGASLRLAESAGLPRTLYGLPEVYPLSGASPAARAHLGGAPVWDCVERPEPSSVPPGSPARFCVAALPLRTAGGGCLLAVTESQGGFDAEDRDCLTLVAGAAAAALTAAPPGPSAPAGPPPAAAPTAPAGPSGGAEAAAGAGGAAGEPPPPTDGAARTAEPSGGAFSLAMDTGRVEVGDAILKLFGIGRNEFDGRVETLLGRTVAEDLPALMSVVEADHMTIGERELEFRILQESGVPRWLRLRGRMLPTEEGRPPRLVGIVADASSQRSGHTDVARVQRLAAALATAGTVKDVGQAFVTALREPLRADRIALAELENDRLVVTVLDPPDPDDWPELWRSEWRTEWPDAPVRTMPTLAAALREGRVQMWPAGSSLEPALAEVGPGGLAVLPLPADGRMAGACLIGWDGPHDFGPDERALLTASAGLAGQALLRARAFDAEHELVGMLQRTLLPRRLPRLPGAEAVARYLPPTAGLQVGGDWYDVIPLPDNHAALVIGDVQGHNAGAAALMGQMRTALRAYAAEGHPPDVVVSHANRLLLEMETELFATCCYVDVDMEVGSAMCVSAGHLPPVLRRPDGTTQVVEVESGPPLGVLVQAEFPMTPLRLLPGTVLAQTTDGLVESPGLDIDVGIARFAADLAAADPAHLGQVADALLSGARRSDDVALLLMRYDGMAVRPKRESWTVWRVPEAVRHARRFTRRTLRSWGAVEEDIDAVLLIVSELVTNALVHTGGQVRLDLTLVGRRFRVAVADSSPRTPVKPAGLSWESTGGRGILLVEAVSTAWGTVPVGGGKLVWADIMLGG